jgi:hypothetical protein
VETTTGSFGNFDVEILDGTWRVEVIPSDVGPAATLGAAEIIEVSEASGLALGTIVLPEFLTQSGIIIDGFGDRISGTRIDCQEVGFGGRSWSTFADNNAGYSLMLPPGLVDCTLVPPGDRLDLAWTVERIDTQNSANHTFALVTGIPVRGTIRLETTGEAFGIVEVRDVGGDLLGSAVTDENGDFALQIR